MCKRNFLILFLILCCLLFSQSLSASSSPDKELKANASTLASLVSLNLYEMEISGLPHIVQSFLQQQPDIQAVRIIESLDKKVVLQIFRDTDGFIVDQAIPDDIIKRNKNIVIPSVFQGETVGKIEVFYKTASDKINLTLEERQWIKNNIVRVGVESWKPILYVNDKNNIDGVSGEFFNKVVEKTGLKIEVVKNTWDTLLNALKNKQIDILPDAYYTERRAKFGLYSTPYFRVQEYIYTREENKNIRYFSDLSRKKVAVVKGFATIDYIRNLKMDIDIIETESLKQSIELVLSGEADALLESRIVCEHFLNKHFVTGLKGIPQFELEASRLHFLSRNDRPILQSILQKGLNSISKKERFEIVANWISTSGHKLIIFSEQEQAWIDKKIPIRYVFDPDWEPFEWTNDVGRHSGIIADLLKTIEFNSGIQFVPVVSENWAEAVEKAKTRQVDMYSGLGETEERKTYMNFSSKNIFSTPYVFVSRENEENIENFKSIQGKRIALVDGYTIHGIMNSQKPDVPLILMDNIQQGFQKLVDDKIDIFIVNAVTAKFYLNHFREFSTLTIASKTEFNLDLKVAIRNDWPPEVLSIINKSIDAISENELVDIYDKWASINVKTQLDYTLLLQILSVVLVIVLVILYWNYKLKSLVRLQTMELTQLIESYDKHVIASKINPTGELVYVSDAFVDISGYDKHELMGQHFQILKQQQISNEYSDDVLDIVAEQGAWEGELQNKNKAGEPYWIKALVSGEYDKKNNIISYSSIQHEITDKKEVEALSQSLENKVDERTRELNEQKQSFEKLFYKTSDALFLMEEGLLIDCNEALVTMMKADNKAQLLNFEPGKFSPTKQPDGQNSIKKARKMMQICNNQGFHRFEWMHTNFNKKNFWTEVGLTKIRISGKDIIHVVWRDISLQKELLETILDAKNRAEETTKSKSQFLANMSHEIRTPMHGIISMAYLLMQTHLDKKQKGYIKIIGCGSFKTTRTNVKPMN